MPKTIKITEEQERFLLEQKGLLFEYYIQASNPRLDFHILGNIQIWVYGDDRQNFTPHCHVMFADKSIEFEVSLLGWNIINVKQPNNRTYDWSSFNEFKKPFFKWLYSKNKFGVLNKLNIFSLWDGTNPNNQLIDFVNQNNIDIDDKELKDYINNF